MKFLDFLRYLDARLGEASTYATLSAMLAATHVSVPDGAWKQVTLWGMIAAGVAGVLLKEAGTKPSTEIAQDMLAQFVSAVKTLPADATKTAATVLLAIGVATGLAACGMTPSQAAQDVDLIATGLEGAIAVAVPNAPTAVTTALSDISAASSAFASADSTTAQQTTAQRISADIQAVANGLGTASNNATVSTAIQAAKTLLASVDAAVGLPAPAAAASAGMSVDAAREALASDALAPTIKALEK